VVMSTTCALFADEHHGRQGDAVTPVTLKSILAAVLEEGFSAESVAFGMGGGLLQKVVMSQYHHALW
jgi:nicotinamide phosphoribosyltransferase